jgi:hypothetical protein
MLCFSKSINWTSDRTVHTWTVARSRQEGWKSGEETFPGSSDLKDIIEDTLTLNIYQGVSCHNCYVWGMKQPLTQTLRKLNIVHT